ncbi:MAG: hypothetical protein LBV46_00490, partial [Bacteroidales bacterium]|nr:hypothetical protein [Bacteroidales bacterium]
DDKLIIDTKYKLKYQNAGGYKIEDIRQLSGYARDERVLKTLGINDKETVVDCIIIYPDDGKPNHFKHRKLIEDNNRIEGFTKFYKCGIKLPNLIG